MADWWRCSRTAQAVIRRESITAVSARQRAIPVAEGTAAQGTGRAEGVPFPGPADWPKALHRPAANRPTFEDKPAIFKGAVR